ncbi:MAG: DUF420 domain-containing protein [Pirellulaceae bacterium]|nr:DUF420 domain-containing protein [Pirellulaceae bacterium]
MKQQLVEILPHVNAGLNLLSIALLLSGLILIKRGREQAHKRTMLTCFAVSVVFLVCYLVYHQLLYATTGERGKRFVCNIGWIRTLYYGMLISHIVLAITVPFLAVTTIYLGLRNQRQHHIRFAKWTFPIWLYVSITGVIVYLMLYQIYAHA